MPPDDNLGRPLHNATVPPPVLISRETKTSLFWEMWLCAMYLPFGTDGLLDVSGWGVNSGLFLAAGGGASPFPATSCGTEILGGETGI